MINVLTGWRGRIGRSIPEPVVKQLLDRTLQRAETPSPLSIHELRAQSEKRSIEAAHNLGVEFAQIVSSSSQSVNATDWKALKHQFETSGLSVKRLHTQGSYAAESVWSVNVSRHSTNIADLRSTGSIWQVYPGEILPAVDAQDFAGRVDAVYTWVDAEDPEWNAAYQRALQTSGRADTDSSVSRARFTSRDELRYSLRSLEMNLPWIDKIYLVTAGQRPKWLTKDHPKLSVIDHREIFSNPEGQLPTFNSHAIESQLSNIPGLKEHFLYINDDVFFGRYLHPNTFYGPAGQSKYCLTQGHFAHAEDKNLPVNLAAANNRQVVVSEFDRTTSRKFQHVAHPQRLAVHQRIRHNYRDQVETIAGHRFRSGTDLSIPSSLAHQFAAQMGLGYPTKLSYQYLDIGAETYYLDLLRLTRNTSMDMFCINEVHAVADEASRGRLVSQFLKARFPIRSSFETF